MGVNENTVRKSYFARLRLPIETHLHAAASGSSICLPRARIFVEDEIALRAM